jgi:transposase
MECTPKVREAIKGASYIEWRGTVLVPRQEYSRELKLAAMRDIDCGKGMAEVARLYQLSPKRLETWRGEWRAKGDLAFPGKGAQPQSNLAADRISELELKIGQQTMEIYFLKKVLRRFSEHPWPVAVNGGTGSMSKSKRRAKRGQS